MSEPFEEEMIRRARHLVTTRGKRVDRGHHDWYLGFVADRLHISLREVDDRVEVGLRHRSDDKTGVWTVYWVSPAWRDESVYKSEFYEECIDLMKPLMVLEDLADV